MSEYLVMTIDREGGYWHPTDLFHDLDTAIEESDKRAALAYSAHRVAVFPAVIDWRDQRHTKEPSA